MRRTLIFVALVLTSMGWFACQDSPPQSPAMTASFDAAIPRLMRLSHEQFGIEKEPHRVVQATFEDQQYLRDVLQLHAVSPATIDEIARKSEPIFDVRKMRAGRPYSLLKGENDALEYFVYEVNESDYVVIDLTDSVRLYTGQRQIDLKEKAISGQIENSLFESVEAVGVTGILAQGLEKIFSWTVDFRDLKKGDRFKIVYQEQFVNGISMGISHIEAAMIEQDGHQFFAFLFPTAEGESAYFDADGLPLEYPFYFAPLSTTEEGDPFDPTIWEAQQVKTNKRHKGNHLLAEKGTAVLAIGSGEIVTMSDDRKAGKYLRIKHNGTYESQYQHLDSFPEKLKKHQRVSQGEVIGYVGNSGSVRRSQVCLRIWEDGKEKDPLSLSYPALKEINPDQKAAFQALTKHRLQQLKALPLNPATKSYVMGK